MLEGFFGNTSPFQIVTAVLAAVGTLAGFYATYKLHWEGPRVEIHAGDRLFLVAPVKRTAPINLMLAITNRGSRTGVLQFLEAYIRLPNGCTERFEWGEFYKYEAGNRVTKEFDPHPVAIPPKGSVVLGVQFVRQSPIVGFAWQNGEHGVILHGWVGRRCRRQRGNVATSFGFCVSEGNAEMLDLASEGGPFGYYPVKVREWRENVPAGSRERTG